MKISRQYPIFTKTIGPSSSRGTRISVKMEGLRHIVYNWEYEFNDEINHIRAKEKFCLINGIPQSDWVGATTPDGYVFIRGVTDGRKCP